MAIQPVRGSVMSVPHLPHDFVPNPHKPMTQGQHAYLLYLRGNTHQMRVESVARAVVGKEFEECSELDAHRLIQYWVDYDPTKEQTPYKVIDDDLGHALTNVCRRSNTLPQEIYPLAFLAMHRVATEGMLARYVFGVRRSTYPHLRGLVKPILGRLLNKGWIACEPGVPVPLFGEGEVADVLHLTEEGSDELHRWAPSVNYFARPSLPPSKLIQHTLAVGDARLDIQLWHNFLVFEPESEIIGERQRKRGKGRRGRRESGSRDGEEKGGCGDFRGYVEDVRTGKVRFVEVEVSVTQRPNELALKPGSVTDHYVSSNRLHDVVELYLGKVAKQVRDFRRPHGLGEKSAPPRRRHAWGSKINPDDLTAVRQALAEEMGGAATAAALSHAIGISPTRASEILSFLAASGEVLTRDGFFPLRNSASSRPRRLHHLPQVRVNSVFDFGRLMTCCALVGSASLEGLFGRPLLPLLHDPTTGVIIFNGYGAAPDCAVIAVADDESEEPERVVRWADAAHRRALCGGFGLMTLGAEGRPGANKNRPGGTEAGLGRPSRYAINPAQVVIATAHLPRKKLLSEAGSYSVICLDRPG